MYTRALNEWKEFVRIPSVSSGSVYRSHLFDCADWLAKHLQKMGMQRVLQLTSGVAPPVVYAEEMIDTAKATLLIYGHYDVQPADPLNEWKTPPFEPTVRGDYLYGRGVSDDKGQLFLHLKAVESLMAEHRLPINIKCLFEGEEEIGSTHLSNVLRTHKALFKADCAVVSDMRMLDLHQPALTYGLRGNIHAELLVTRQGTDLHSGIYGGIASNPIHGLAHIIAKLHTTKGQIALPCFYDDVFKISTAERTYMRKNGPSNAQLRREMQGHDDIGEENFTAYEQLTIRPSLTVTGISGGYQGEGSKGVIPRQARAKLNFRLVPHQDSNQIAQSLSRYVAQQCPSRLRVEVSVTAQSNAYQVNPDERVFQAASSACQNVFGRKPVLLRSGGSIPIVSTLAEQLRLPVVMMGFASPFDNLHAPNERFYIPNFFRGVETSKQFIKNLEFMRHAYH
ncbi:dipeptidase [Runella aurantiaca]|uniref:Dipeptidase n=1 Tax=Runella aurantiaca TaxID=2282308 RepID=A0A369IHB1_9BACT|nr:dipeptidase [Runella aurantiaca]RDB07575.1 dipeptidase [Runella aurantiaca]